MPKIRSDALHPVESAEVTADGASADFQRALQNEIAPPADVPITMPEPASRVVPTLSSEPLQSNTDADAVPNSQTDKVMEPAPPFQMGNESPTLTDSAHGLEQIVDSVEPAPTLTALPLGTVLQDRFTLVELMRQAPDENIYRARDEWRCPSCNFENEADAV
ncbi:MAG TPA: hypothetical protein VFD70_15810, partial [Anaerolineae bacterium]|nr:hypothetical protein [Anaerolineae bacterium]